MNWNSIFNRLRQLFKDGAKEFFTILAIAIFKNLMSSVAGNLIDENEIQVIENLRMMDYKFALVQAKVEYVFQGTPQISYR